MVVIIIPKVKVGILGTGNVGTDLLVKIQRSGLLECVMFAGIRKDSPGIARAKQMGVKTSIQSISAILTSEARIVFDCTTAKSHLNHAPFLRDRFVIDLTPSRVGNMCVPLVNLKECLTSGNVNLASCGAQAIVPLAKVIMEIYPDCEYMEIVSSMSSCSAGMGTRNNIDEFTQTTAKAIEELTGVKKAKAIIILNPAVPPVIMQNTLYAKISNPNIRMLKSRIKQVVKQIQEYVPGYELVVEPTYEKQENRVVLVIRCIGRGDYLPKYAGNLDIITANAVKIAEEYAKNKNN